jgi:hypothetical protein
MAQETKPKKATIRMVDKTSAEGGWIYKQVHDLVGRDHKGLADASIGVAYKLNWSDDADGRTEVGKAVLVPELYWRVMEAEGMEPADFYLLLNATLWERLEEAQRLYLLDELLCQCDQKLNRQKEHAEDETGRKLFRTRKPDLAAFAAPIKRHGLQLRGVRTFFEACGVKGEQIPLFAGTEPEPAVTATH